MLPTNILDIPAPIWISFPNLQITVETAAAVPPLTFPDFTLALSTKAVPLACSIAGPSQSCERIFPAAFFGFNSRISAYILQRATLYAV